jgi:hypothetical protein
MRRVLSGILFTAGVVLATLGAARLLFGVAMDLPLLPPISLEGVNVVAMIAGALVCFAAAAPVRRAPATVPAQDGDLPR